MNRTSLTATALTLLLGAPALALAGQGAGPGDGTGPVHDFSTAACSTITGTVASAGTAGSGYVIDDGIEALSVFGIGPIGYWNALELVPPQVGESVTADVCWLTFSDGSEKAIATAVTLSDGSYIELRDALTGQPAWRGSQGGGQGAGGQMAGQGLADCTGPR